MFPPLKLEKPPPYIRAQTDSVQSAPQIISTPFRKVRYQKKASFAERCRIFWRENANRDQSRYKIWNFSGLHYFSPASLVRIRGPPVNLNLSDFRLIGGITNGWKPSEPKER